MKKEKLLILFILIAIFLIPSAFAVEITLSKESYFPFETLQAEITGNFVSLAPENVFIYKDGIPRPNPVISDLTKQGEKYYFYALLPKEEGDYSLKIQNTEYVSEGELKKQDLIKNFTIKKTNLSSSVLSISPGFIIAENEFSIKIKSPYINQKIGLTLEATGDFRNISLIESEEKTIEFSTAGLDSQKTNLKIGSYNIPVFIIKGLVPPEKKELVFSPSSISAIVTPGSDYFFKIIIENIGDKNISNINFSNNLNAVINPSSIAFLRRGERKTINITIPVSEKAKNNLSGEIIAEFDSNSSILKVFFEITKNQTKVNLSGTTVTPGLSCSKIGGKKCIFPEVCNGDTTESLEGPCCLGECGEKPEPASYSWIFGIILLVVLIGVVFLVLRKSKLRQRPKSSEDILKEKTERFEERMKPSEEVSGKIGRL